MHDLFIFIALGVASFSFSNCTEERGVIYKQFENSNDVTPV